MDKSSKVIVSTVLKLPTMSFHETAVTTFVRWYAAGLGLRVTSDRAGNLLVKYRGGRGGVTFCAHTDHPGFEVISSQGTRATVALWGKVDPRDFAGSKVTTYTDHGAVKGKIGRALSKKHLGRICFPLKATAKVAKGDFGHYDLPGVRFRGDRIFARAADNLMGVSAILDLMTRLVKAKARVNVSGLFTRGEEAGFLGAFAAMESGLIPRRDPVIVLECSSAPAGKVNIGGGPVIRCGDLQSTYDPVVDVWLQDVATGLKVKEKKFSYQRALLQGGRCEACVYSAQGYRTGALALPLGNYHNKGPRGYAAEYVSASDYEDLLRFMEALAQNPMSKDAIKVKVAAIKKHYKGLKGKLVASRA